MPIAYTPELVSELKSLVAGLPRPAGVKAVQKRLKIAERTARFTYAKYFGETVPPHQQPPAVIKKETSDKVSVEVKTHQVEELDDVLRLCKVDQTAWRVQFFATSKTRS